jgi:hypothetical protein
MATETAGESAVEPRAEANDLDLLAAGGVFRFDCVQGSPMSPTFGTAMLNATPTSRSARP